MNIDIDYINDMYWIIMRLSHYIRHNNNKINYSTVEEMISLTIDLLNILEQYINDYF